MEGTCQTSRSCIQCDNPRQHWILTLLSHVPKLAIGALLGLSLENNDSKSQNGYVEIFVIAWQQPTKVKESAIQTANNNKRRYGVAAQATVLHPGDFVLVREHNVTTKTKLIDTLYLRKGY